MEGRSKLVMLAIIITILDAMVFQHHGLTVWRVLSGTVWIRCALLLLASVWASSLIDIWAHALPGATDSRQTFGGNSSGAVVTIPGDLEEGADV